MGNNEIIVVPVKEADGQIVYVPETSLTVRKPTQIRTQEYYSSKPRATIFDAQVIAVVCGLLTLFLVYVFNSVWGLIFGGLVSVFVILKSMGNYEFGRR